MRKKLILLSASIFALASCGASLKYAYSNNLYNSTIWENNYYREHLDCLSNATLRNTITLMDDEVFLSFEDTLFKNIDPEGSKLDKYLEYGDESYSYNNKLSNYSASFKNGYVSKLYDGKMYCFGRYETVRMQIDHTGFNSLFNAIMLEGDYLALNFKSELDFKSGVTTRSHITSMNLNIRLYFYENNCYVYDIFTYHFDVLVTSGDVYYFYGFSLKPYNSKNAIGIGIDYDNYVDDDNPDNLDHALLLYELYLPNSSWN